MFSGVIAAQGMFRAPPPGSWLPARFRRCGRIKLRFFGPLVGRFACLFLLLLGRSPHSITQRWVRRIVEAFPELDGLRYNSRFDASDMRSSDTTGLSQTPGHQQSSALGQTAAVPWVNPQTRLGKTPLTPKIGTTRGFRLRLVPGPDW